ncbi:MAG: helix-hairpin-helix domain-containing protein [Actinomycetota bacterium]
MNKPDPVDRICDFLALRFDQYVDRWQVIAALVAAAAVLAFCLFSVIRSQIIQPTAVVKIAAKSSSADGNGKKTSADICYIHVCGAVNKPGVYRVGAGIRVNAVVALAGGLTADAETSTVNLAKKVADGEKIYIPRKGEATPSSEAGGSGAVGQAPVSASGMGGGASGTAWTTEGKLNLNIASAEDLDKLPGVGPVLAARILDYRQKHKGLADIEQIAEVSGIGPKTYEKMKPYICVE